MSFGQAVALAAKVCFVLGAAVALIILAGCGKVQVEGVARAHVTFDDPEVGVRCYVVGPFSSPAISCVTTEY